MVHWKSFDMSTFSSVPVRDRKTLYDDNIFTLDVEATSIFYDGKKYMVFDYSKPPEYYKDMEKYSILYIWQFSINDSVVYGRTLPELLDFLQQLREKLIGRIIVYIHNLSYEFQFLRNIINDFTAFARKPRHPIKAHTEQLNIEFRCSYMLTNMSLAKLPNALGLTVNKKVGQLDYNKLHLPTTELTPDELEYCEYDCIVLSQAIGKYKDEYKHVYNIPLTQTGKLRRIVKQMYKGNSGYYNRLKNMLPITYDEFNMLSLAYSGGYTHANALYTNNIIENVFSFDITSSYPTVMVAEEFPMSRFVKTHVTDINALSDKKAYIIDITFTDIKAAISCTYLSKSKAIKLYDCIEDNGRLVTAQSARYILTDMDLKIVQRAYKFDYKINACYVAHKERLDVNLVKFILQLYSDKTTFKDVDGKEDLYKRAKEYINAMYGMAVTNTVRDEVEFNGTWSVKPLTVADAEAKLEKLTHRGKTFMNYSWGVWVTAYARYNLWAIILDMPDDVIYTDTDSIKFVNDSNLRFFKAYNEMITKKLLEAIEYHGLDKELIKPKTPKGVEKPLGIYDQEPSYEKFVTMGAKKYCDIKEGHLELTVSGVNKKNKKGVVPIQRIEDFREGHIFDYEDSGRLVMDYLENQPTFTVTDYQGHTETIQQQYGVNAMPTTYTLGISSAYDDYLIRLAGQTSTHLSIMIGKEDFAI